MKITILTMFPQLFDSFREGPVVQRAIRKGSLELSVVDIKEFAPGSFRHIDDSPFGGGAGMVMRCQPVLDALRSVRGSAESGSDVSPQGSAADADAANTAQPDVVRMNEKTASGTIAAALSPAGRQFTQKQAHRLPELDYWKRHKELNDGGKFDAFKKQLVDEINALGIPGMPKVESLNALVGSYVNLAYPLPGGAAVRFLDDSTTYLGTQLEVPGEERYFGVLANADFILICTYAEGGTEPELLLYKKR